MTDADFKLRDTTHWHIAAHRLTGDPGELVKLQKLAAKLSPGSFKYRIEQEVVLHSPVDTSLRGLPGVIRAVLMDFGGPRYYVVFASGSGAVVSEGELARRPAGRRDVALTEVDVEEGSEPLSPASSGQGSSDGSLTLPFTHSARVARQRSLTSSIGMHNIGSDILLSSRMPRPGSQRPLGAAVGAMAPASVGLDSDIHAMRYRSQLSVAI